MVFYKEAVLKILKIYRKQTDEIGYFPEKIQTGVLRIYFFENPLEFFISYFTPGNSRQNKVQPLDIPQNCVRFLGNCKAKKKDPWKFHIIFLGHPWIFHFVFN